MKRLALALYAEGTTDERFLPSVIQRTSIEILKRHEKQFVDVAVSTIPKDRSTTKLDECILQAAIKAATFNILIVHCDADHPTSEKALQDRFHPGYELVQQIKGPICKLLVPVVPVRMTEAWMLAADHELLREVLRTDMKAQDLGLVNKAKQVESDPNPKHTLKMIMQKASASRSRRHAQIDIGELYIPLGRRISLERLNQVPSYKQFVHDLTSTLKSLNLLQ